MTRASWNGVVIAESTDLVKLEGNYYFPAESLVGKYFEPSKEKTRCPWKGVARYYDVVVDGERNPAAAWYYPRPKKAAAEITGRVAFWRGVEVTD